MLAVDFRHPLRHPSLSRSRWRSRSPPRVTPSGTRQRRWVSTFSTTWAPMAFRALQGPGKRLKIRSRDVVHLKMHFKSAASPRQLRDASSTPEAPFPRFGYSLPQACQPTRPSMSDPGLLELRPTAIDILADCTCYDPLLPQLQICKLLRIYSSSNTG